MYCSCIIKSLNVKKGAFFKGVAALDSSWWQGLASCLRGIEKLMNETWDHKMSKIEGLFFCRKLSLRSTLALLEPVTPQLL